MRQQSTVADLADLARIRRMCQTGRARRIRVGAGASLSEVSDPVGVARQTILKWERDERKPRGEAALRYLAVLEELSGV